MSFAEVEPDLLRRKISEFAMIAQPTMRQERILPLRQLEEAPIENEAAARVDRNRASFHQSDHQIQ